MYVKKIIATIGLMSSLYLVGCNRTQPTQPAPPQPPQTSQTQPATNPPTATTPATPPAATQVSGLDLYNANCLKCHQANGAGSDSGPVINTSEFRNNSTKVQNVVKKGRGKMPAFANTLNATQIKAIGDYVASLK